MQLRVSSLHIPLCGVFYFKLSRDKALGYNPLEGQIQIWINYHISSEFLRIQLEVGKMKRNWVLKSGKTKWLMGLKVHRDSFKRVKSLDWWSAVVSVR